MTTAAIAVRRLLSTDAACYREIRLEALLDSPDAFSSTFESEQAHPLDWFAQRLADAAVFGAFRDVQLLGVAGFFIQPGTKHAHRGTLWGMYVRPAGRGGGIGRRLVEAVIVQARRHVELLQLRVVSDNAPARRLYERLGFVEYGIEWHAAKYRGRYHDDLLMMLPLVVYSEPDTTCAAAEVTPHDRALQPPEDGGDLGAGELFPHPARNRGLCLRGAGGARRHPRERGAGGARTRRLRCRAHRRDRA